VASILFLALSAAGAINAADKNEDAVFAKVGASTITVREYGAALRERVRKRFFHGTPPESQIVAFQREVADELIDRKLLLQEAGRRKLRAKPEALAKELENHRRRIARKGQHVDENSEAWRALRERLGDELLVEQLEKQVRTVAPPSVAEVKDYYRNNPEKFTEPKQLSLSIILLRVEPSSPGDVWEAAKNEAQNLVQRLRGGADFAELARLHSADASAQKGGEMGYVHKGMLGESVQKAVEGVAVGKVSDPVMTLEGYAVFRVAGQRPARLNTFTEVEERARRLWVQEAGERAWQGLLEHLRATTPIEVDERYLKPAGPAKEADDASGVAPHTSGK